MKQILIPALLALTVQLACSTTKPPRITATWSDKAKVAQLKQKEGKIFIAAMTQNIEVKTTLENDLAAAANSKGVQAVRSFDVFPPEVSKEHLPSAESILRKIRELGCDAIFTVVLVDAKSETRYVAGSGDYAPFSVYPYYGGFAPYYGYSTMVYEPGYYSTDETYFLESNLYDATTTSLVMSMQTKVVNPSTVEKSSHEYTKALLDELDKQGMLKRQKK
jgi:hypothetical protein